MVSTFLHPYIDELTALCRQHRVSRLYAFGSVTSESFDPGRSDVDMIVELPNEFTPERSGETYFMLLFELEKLFHRRVDLIMGQSFENPYFARAVDQSKLLIYAA